MRNSPLRAFVDLTRKDGPRVTEKEKKDKQDKNRQEGEKANRIEHKVEAKMDHVRGIFHPEYIKKKR